VIQIESARSLRDRHTNPDAFDLILRARSLENLPPTVGRRQEALALFERALALNPTSVDAMTGAAFFLVDTDTDWHNFDNMHAARRAPGGAGTRGGSQLRTGAQHIRLLASLGGPLRGGHRGRATGHSDGPQRCAGDDWDLP
jgi:hypothetical protein